MRIALMFRTTEGPWGGGNSFLRALKKHWLESGVEVTDKLDGDLDGVLFNSSNSGQVQANGCLRSLLTAWSIPATGVRGHSGYGYPDGTKRAVVQRLFTA